MLKLILAFAVLIFSSFVFAKPVDEGEPPIKKGTMIQVQSYNEKSKTYDIVMPKYEAQGPNYATVADLVKALPSVDAKRVVANPRTIVGMEYVLDNDLKLQDTAKVEALQKPPAPKKPAKSK